MGNITEITRRDIFNLFQNGYEEQNWYSGDRYISYLYYGQLTKIEFLKKLYPLDKMPSLDSRFENAEKEILQHIANNNGLKVDCIFKDERFELLKGNDIILLSFLCAVFHPENRKENGHWKKFLDQINEFIKIDGYELYVSEKISGRNIYSWREITPEESVSVRFLPFSVRNKKALEAKNIKISSISKKIRAEFVNLFNRYNETLDRITETNWRYSIGTTEALIEDVSSYYTPKAFDTAKKYIETKDFEQFVMNNYPCYVFDAIELFAQYNGNHFVDEINIIFQNSGSAYRLLGGKIEIGTKKIQINEIINEEGLKELIERAALLYNSGNTLDKPIAVQKLWDAFERMKTYYTTLDKKKSVKKIVNEISENNDYYNALFEEEFNNLTKIGNEIRIRHHETTKIDITNNNYYDYFYHRCFALINLALKYLK